MAAHKPVRTCIVCRQKKTKSDLLRFIRTMSGEVEIDPTKSLPGRGAYCCFEKSCLLKLLKKNHVQRVLSAVPTARFKEHLLRLVDERFPSSL